MKIASIANKLSEMPQAGSRVVDFRVWMIRNNLTFVEIGKHLGGITGNAVHYLIKADRIPVARHEELVALGVPVHLLPPAQDVRRGRRPKK
ncbi:hypothetical protein LJC47_03070 [Desulfosarcina sp. OttesenSCG-928-B08]|nr:hypothetical protein [Desulfosarcina sp. OttesenSCG-928-B08]